ncbi:ZNF134 isoform 2 [Pongo abelii]|uniref:ZNF134 isoform 2 n=1 Tax=Pongo abelii TaxID=9601 RepID=A0A2J8RQ65_PONAB|nr:ZNF134 isoform 2 [Pongo abelii]
MTLVTAGGAWTGPGEWELRDTITSGLGSCSSRNLCCAHHKCQGQRP